MGGAGSDTLAGNGGNDVLIGGLDADTLNGGAGADTMNGGPGNDRYYVDNAGDSVIEAFASGTDTVNASVTFALAADVEKLTLTGSAAINGTGNSLSNTIVGNAAANTLSGLAGADSLNGGGGADRLKGGADNDTLNGAAGADTLYGGAGKDTLTGGTGADKFMFDAALSASTNVDRITDFSVVDDTIGLDISYFAKLSALGTLSASAFYAGTSAHDANDRIVYDSATGKLYYDADGTGAGAQVLFAQVQTGLALTNSDFLVVA
jgi:serralysin